MDRKSIAVAILSCVAAFAFSTQVAMGAPVAPAQIALSPENMVVGIVSFYDDPQETASGEAYDPHAFTAAAQLEIRDRFGGIKFGRLYEPAYGLGEFEGKKIIVKLNDVGPLMPGRKFDLSRAAMAYFDASLEKGLLPDFRMHPLPLGKTYPTGPVTDEQLVALGIGGSSDDGIATASIPVVQAELQPDIPDAEQSLVSDLIFTSEVATPEQPASDAVVTQADDVAPVLDNVTEIRERSRAFDEGMIASVAEEQPEALEVPVLMSWGDVCEGFVPKIPLAGKVAGRLTS